MMKASVLSVLMIPLLIMGTFAEEGCLEMLGSLQEGSLEMEKQLVQCRSHSDALQMKLDTTLLEKHKMDEITQSQINELKIELKNKLSGVTSEDEASISGFFSGWMNGAISIGNKGVSSSGLSCDEIEQENEDLRESNDQLVLLGRALRNKLQAMKSAVHGDSLEFGNVEGLERELDLKKEIYTLKDQLKQFEELKTENGDLSQQIYDLNLRIETFQREKHQLEADINSKAAELNEMKDEIHQHEEQVESLTMENEKLKVQIDNYKDMEALFHEYKAKLEDPAITDYVLNKLNWMQNPEVEGVQKAYLKALKYMPENEYLNLENMKLMLQLSSKNLSEKIGKPEYHPVISGFLFYGIVFIPLVICIGVFVRFKNKKNVSLKATVIWMSMYNFLFSACVYVMSILVEEEGLSALRVQSETAFEFLQLVVAIYYIAYVANVMFVVGNEIIFENKCAVTLKNAAQIMLPIMILTHYYQKAFLPAMRDHISTMHTKDWLFYSITFFAMFLFFRFSHSNQESASSSVSTTKVQFADDAQVDDRFKERLNPASADDGKETNHRKKKRYGNAHRRQSDDRTVAIEVDLESGVRYAAIREEDSAEENGAKQE